MLKLFKSDRLAQAYKAIESDNLEKLQKLTAKITADEVNQTVSDSLPPLAEACILNQSAKALKLVLQTGANPDQTSFTQPELNLPELCLRQEKSHALLSALFAAGAKTDPNILIISCFQHCNEQELMLHLSLLIQHGAQLDESIVHRALTSGQLPLIHFVINSGAPKPDDLQAQNYPEELMTYANRCWEDIKIRNQFL